MASRKLKSVIVVGACVAATIATMVIKSKQAAALRAENQALQGEMEHLRKPDANESARTPAPGEDIERLKREAAEVHKLRGEVALLRRERADAAKLAGENARLRQRLRESATEPETPPEQIAEREAQKQIGIAKMNNLKQWVLAFRMFADEHDGRMPKDFEEAKRHLPAEFSHAFHPSQFEIVYQESLDQLHGSNGSQLIVVRERDATVDLKGRKIKAYGFADGHSEIRVEPPEGFEAWEKARMATAGAKP